LSELMVAIKSSTIDIEEGMCAEKEWRLFKNCYPVSDVQIKFSIGMAGNKRNDR
jgi:hypothetical protein